MQEPENYALALAFDTDDAGFARGVEVGRLWEQLNREEAVEQEIHSGNAEMVLRMAEATGRRVVCVELGEEWLLARFAEAAEPSGFPPDGSSRRD